MSRRPVQLVDAREELKLPPHSAEAEQSVLGAMMLDNASIALMEGELSAKDFYVDGHRLIFEHALRLHAGAAPVDVVTLAESLKADGKFDYIGGMSYLGTLIANVPTAKNVLHYAGIIRDRAMKRVLMAAAYQIADSAAANLGPESAVLLADAQAKLETISDAVGQSHPCSPLDLPSLASAPVPQRHWRVGKIMPAGAPGLWTGHGGAGKTQAALALAIAAAGNFDFFGEPVTPGIAGFVSTEDDGSELHIRLAAQCAAMNADLAALDGRLFVYDLTHTDPTLISVDDEGHVVPTPRYVDLRTELRRRAIDLLFLDNWSTLCAVDLIRPGHVTTAMSLLARLVPAHGNTVILHHVDKATAKAGYGSEAYSGTAALHNRSRWRWYSFSPDRVEDADENGDRAEDDGRRILEVQKLNAGRMGTRIPMRICTADGPTSGAVVADGVVGGIVAQITRENERKGVLRAVAEAQEREIPVPTATTNRNTAYEALEAMPSFPDALRGKSGKRRLFRLLMQIRADGDFKVVHFIGSGRHRREGYQLARIEK